MPTIESSLIEFAEYDAELSVLVLYLVGGRVYKYFDVPSGVYSDLLAADSAGSFFNRKIKNEYRFENAAR
ncbi:KTSC domain-containing protein [Notoacmeibacter ruber]|uniref:KTSC domain-containing protein n=1 Tax=Notoacmeibacter ruber TaxID=2670375 RepID=A0A3L7JBR6_9HYPH|nr:KTSC domain-containing protein [Notoacmeibacter ruber]